MNTITTEEWNDLVYKVGNIGDRLNNSRIEAQLHTLNGSLEVTNIILGIIAITYIVSVFLKYKKDK